jgi:hypothetical protein
LTADDVIAGAKGKPQPFEYLGFTYLLRPVTRLEFRSFSSWRAEQGERDGVGRELQEWIVGLAVCDESGVSILATFDKDQPGKPPVATRVPELPTPAIDAIADEVAKRNWMPPEGKGDSAKTPA